MPLDVAAPDSDRGYWMGIDDLDGELVGTQALDIEDADSLLDLFIPDDVEL